MNTHRIDRRVQRTRQSLSEALFVLIREMGYEAITVQDITEQAKLGRTTFYLHYRDKEELLAASVKRLINGLRKDVNLEAASGCPFRNRSILVFEQIAQQQALYQALLGDAGPPGIAVMMRTYFAEQFQQNIVTALNSGWIKHTTSEVLAAHAAGSFLGLLTWWLEHDLVLSAQEMGEMYWEFLETGIDKGSKQISS